MRPYVETVVDFDTRAAARWVKLMRIVGLFVGKDRACNWAMEGARKRLKITRVRFP